MPIIWQSEQYPSVGNQRYGANTVYVGKASPSGGTFTPDFITAATKDVRCPKAMVEVTWASPLIDPASSIVSNDINRIDRKGQIINDKTISAYKWAYLHGGLIADGSFHPMPNADTGPEMGWYGNAIGDGSGNYTTDPYIEVTHAARPYTSVTVSGDSIYEEYPVDFTVELTHTSGTETIVITGNTELQRNEVFAPITGVTKVKLTIHKWSKASTIVKITEMSGTLIELYRADDIIGLTILEETNSDTGIVPIGNVSANELDLTLANTDRRFSYGNTDSIYNEAVKSGRKIRVWLGFVLPTGSSDASGDVPGYIVETEAGGVKCGYMPYGTYWSKDWHTSYDNQEARTTAYDVAYSLSQKKYRKSANFTGTVEDIVDAILEEAKTELPELTWAVSADTAAVEWDTVAFGIKNYLEILKDIAEATESFTFVDRFGVLQVGSFLEAVTPLENYALVDLSDYYNYKTEPKIDEVVNSVRVGYTPYDTTTTIFDSDRTYTMDGASQTEKIDWNVDGADPASVTISLEVIAGTPTLGTIVKYETGADVTINGAIGAKFKLSATGIPVVPIYADDTTVTVPASGSITLDLVWSVSPIEISSIELEILAVSGTPELESSSVYAFGGSVTVVGLAGVQFKLTATGTPYTQIENTETIATDDDSIRLYGLREFSLTGNTLINSIDQAESLAAQLVQFYGGLRQDGSMEWPASSLLSVGDTLEVVEFQSDTVTTKDFFIIKRQTTVYDGSLQGSTELRRG